MMGCTHVVFTSAHPSAALERRLKECRYSVGKSQKTLANISHALKVTLRKWFAPLSDVSLLPSGARRNNAALPPELQRSRLRWEGWGAIALALGSLLDELDG